MRILQVLPTLSAGGAEGFVTNLGVSLAALGADVRFYLLAGVREKRGQVLLQRLHNAGIDVIGKEERNIRSPSNLVGLFRQIHSWKPDVTQANLHSSEVACAMTRLTSSAKSTAWVRRLANTDLGNIPALGQWFLDRSYDLTIACSPAVEESFRGQTASHFKRSILTIPNGGHLLETPPELEEKIAARASLGLPIPGFVITHIGRMFGRNRSSSALQNGQKGHDILLRGFARAFEGKADKFLVLVGDGPLKEEAKSLAKSLGIAEQTLFIGQQPEPWTALKAADMFCFPSRWEGLPNVLPEAASCGLPILASDIKEIRSICPGDGWLLRPVEDVEGFAGGLKEIAENILMFRKKAYDNIPSLREQFSMETCAKEYLKAFKSSLAI